MSFRDNLQHMRATKNMTQEQLAMLLGVSRQSVTKWEAERAYPEMDKLIKICQIFDCTLDELVQGDLTSRTPDPTCAATESLGTYTPQDICGYDEHMRSFARSIATGVAAIIAGVAIGSAFEGAAPSTFSDPDAITLIFVFLGVVIGMALLVPAGINHTRFVKEHPFVEDFYTPEDHSHTNRLTSRCVVFGIAFIFLGVLASLMSAFSETTQTVIFLAFVAAGVWAFIYGGIMHGRLDIASYNKEAVEELSDAEIANLYSDDEQRKRAFAARRKSKLTGTVCGIIMLAATIIMLVWLFIPTANAGFSWNYDSGIGSLFWLPLPIGGICCGIAAIVIGSFKE
ncbi:MULTISPECIES: helix-turn-helix transcriptional regulator [unclassified Adlercreutzia]|uniref:helix-turn-helix transcriptional regulator n=1 Tax=unclassified Adlercreutzia TaxID=2636013 RepID=UPI0013E9AC54|nr:MULTISPECIES: helix-turn-helix transcriptional regulator [unclassified Adlercreutzia]